MLLCHRRPERLHFPDVWDLPGGRVEPGESLLETLRRELEEELGIVPQPSPATPWSTLTNDSHQLHVFLVDEWTGEPANLAPEEHDEIRWVGRRDIDELSLADHSYVEMLDRALA